MAYLKSEILKNGINPTYEKEELSDLQQESLTVSRAAATRVISAQIKNSTEKYYQHKLSNGSPVGCGPVAWTIVYAY